jgi:sterol desaturase/sphingolipid hydroxylase (fatty acid hydroxylase superfamily)
MLNWLLTLEEAVMLQTVSRLLPELPLFLMTAVATHLVMSFAQTLMHYKLGHHPMGGKFFRNHINFHHTYYSKDHLVSRTYRGDEGNNTPFFFIPVFLVGACTYLVLPIDLFVVQVVACAASFYAHVFFDKEYHVEGSRLQRFAWFRRKQELHFVHHRHANCNFAVIHFFWDRILGTYRRPDARFRGQKGVPNQLVSDSKPHLLSRCDLESNAAWKSLYGVNLGPSDLTVKSDLSGDAVGPVLFSALEGMMAFALVAGPDLTLGIEPSEFTGETLLGHVGGEDVLPVPVVN